MRKSTSVLVQGRATLPYKALAFSPTINYMVYSLGEAYVPSKEW